MSSLPQVNPYNEIIIAKNTKDLSKVINQYRGDLNSITNKKEANPFDVVDRVKQTLDRIRISLPNEIPEVLMDGLNSHENQAILHENLQSE